MPLSLKNRFTMLILTHDVKFFTNNVNNSNRRRRDNGPIISFGRSYHYSIYDKRGIRENFGVHRIHLRTSHDSLYFLHVRSKFMF